MFRLYGNSCFSLSLSLYHQSSESSDLSDGPITMQEFMEVKNALNASEAKIQQLLKVNCHLSEELRHMQSKVGDPAPIFTLAARTLIQLQLRVGSLLAGLLSYRAYLILACCAARWGFC